MGVTGVPLRATEGGDVPPVGLGGDLSEGDFSESTLGTPAGVFNAGIERPNVGAPGEVTGV